MKSKFNVVGNKTVDRGINLAARALIEGITAYTPASEAEIDRIMGLGTVDGACEPDPEILAEFGESTDRYAWMKREPTVAELQR